MVGERYNFYSIANKYLTPLKQTGVDTLVLGCTHYPLLKNTISKVMGEGVTLVSSAFEVARVVKEPFWIIICWDSA